MKTTMLDVTRYELLKRANKRLEQEILQELDKEIFKWKKFMS